MLQLSSNMPQTEPTRRAGRTPRSASPRTLCDLRRGDAAILDRLELPVEEARRLMALGFLPGARVVAALSAPGGDPRVFQVDGSEVALRRETAAHIVISPPTAGR